MVKVVRNLSVVILVVVMLVRPPLAYATVASGAVSSRNVFTLSVSGAAKVAAAEVTVANAMRVLGLIGRLSGYVGLGLVLYDIAANTWDWWHQTYDTGVAGTAVPTGTGNWGVTGSATYGGATKCADGFSLAADTLPSYVTVVGRKAQSSTTSFGGVHGACDWSEVYVVLTSTLPSSSVAGASVALGGATNRQAVIAQLDGAIADLASSGSAVINNVAVPIGTTYDSIRALLLAARNYISNGVALSTGDYTHGSGWTTGSAANPGNVIPGAVPVGGETSTSTQNPPAADNSSIVSAISSMSAAVVSAVQAIPTAIAASQTAVVSAVQAVAAPIVAAVRASQAAVVSAVNAVATAVSGVTSHVDEVKTAVRGVQSSTDAVKSSVDSLKAQEAAQAAAVTPAQAPAFICPTCTRVTSWATLFSSLQTTAMAAPIFALITHLAWPGTGSLAHTWTMGSWQGHSMTVDLSASGLSTAITVVRFVVIGGAVIVAYMIIFG